MLGIIDLSESYRKYLKELFIQFFFYKHTLFFSV